MFHVEHSITYIVTLSAFSNVRLCQQETEYRTERSEGGYAGFLIDRTSVVPTFAKRGGKEALILASPYQEKGHATSATSDASSPLEWPVRPEDKQTT